MYEEATHRSKTAFAPKSRTSLYSSRRLHTGHPIDFQNLSWNCTCIDCCTQVRQAIGLWLHASVILLRRNETMDKMSMQMLQTVRSQGLVPTSTRMASGCSSSIRQLAPSCCCPSTGLAGLSALLFERRLSELPPSELQLRESLSFLLSGTVGEFSTGPYA